MKKGNFYMIRLVASDIDGTLLFVSHDINQVQQLCQRSIWLDHGVLRGDGPSREVCADYVRAMEAGET